MPNPYILEMREIAASYDLSDICAEVLNVPEFAVWTGAPHPNLHHYGHGGLAKHTYEVLRLCLDSYRALSAFGGPAIDPQVLVAAAIYHDFGKVTDYRPTDDSMTGWESTDDKHLVYHISRSAIHWSKAVDRHPRHRSIETPVLHAILAHHGLKQWSSPVEPRTREAWILHLSDQMSARVNDCDTLHLKR